MNIENLKHETDFRTHELVMLIDNRIKTDLAKMVETEEIEAKVLHQINQLVALRNNLVN